MFDEPNAHGTFDLKIWRQDIKIKNSLSESFKQNKVYEVQVS